MLVKNEIQSLFILSKSLILISLLWYQLLNKIFYMGRKLLYQIYKIVGHYASGSNGVGKSKKLKFGWSEMVLNGFQALTFPILNIIFVQNCPNLITGGSISQGRSHFGIICIKMIIGCLKTKRKILFFLLLF